MPKRRKLMKLKLTRAYLSTPLIVAIVRQSSLCESWDVIESTSTRAVVQTTRRGQQPQMMQYTLDEAKAAGLYPGKKEHNVWNKNPGLMLRHQAERRLAHQVYPDVLRGKV